MYDNQVFSQGVQGILKGTWELSCETPLVIRNGMKIHYTAAEDKKIRNKDVQFHWQAKDPANKKASEVACLHYGYEINEGKAKGYYFVPASSVRGALRSWTIRQLVLTQFHEYMTPPEAEDQEATTRYIAKMREALANPASGYPLVASLFGLAFDAREESGIEGNAGRFSLQTEAFAGGQGKPIAVNGNLLKGEEGPGNARREMVVRNPLDRITHASKEAGLHHFLEFCKGETFGVHLTILNPVPGDLGLVSLWVREMNAGLLRLGALSSIGRGRVSVKAQTYQLWQMPGKGAWPHFTACSPAQPEKEALTGFWQCSSLDDPEKMLPEFEKTVLDLIGGGHASPQPEPV